MTAPHIVLIVADALRPDMGVLGYPRTTTPMLDPYLRRARGFTRCWSVCGWTLPSCASIITGQMPSVHGLTDHDGRFSQPKLGHHLGPGYRRQAIGNNGNLVPDDIDDAYLQRLGVERNGKWKRFGWNDGFDRFDWFHRVDHAGPFARAKAFLAEQAQSEQPHLLFLHTNVVHDYGTDSPAYQQVPAWFDGELPQELQGFPDGPGTWSQLRKRFDDRYLSHQIKARYDCGIRELDRQLADLFTQIDFDNTVVVLTSDHGEGFRPALGRVHHCGRLHDDLLRVPLFLWAPARFAVDAGLDTRISSSLDIVPTLLELAGRPIKSLPGQSLLKPMPNGHRPLVAEDRGYAFRPGQLKRQTYDDSAIELRSELTWPLKTIRLRINDEVSEQCFNLAVDPDEERELLALPAPSGLPRLSIVVVLNDAREFKLHNAHSPLYNGGRHQWVVLDNTDNRLGHDITRLYAQGQALADNDLILFAHQDVYFPPGWENDFAKAVHELSERDPDWGVIGSVGVALGLTAQGARRVVGHWCDPGGHRRNGRLPAAVQSLDEQWLCIRRASGLTFDEALPGFHCYGVDLCFTAQSRGMACYAVDAFVWHKYRDADGQLPLSPRQSEKIVRRVSPEFIAEAQKSYRYVGAKWSARIPFFSTSMGWTDPANLVYSGPYRPPPR